MINKIFGIGLGKTGTCSLKEAFEKMGFKSVHYLDPDTYKNIHKFNLWYS